MLPADCAFFSLVETRGRVEKDENFEYSMAGWLHAHRDQLTAMCSPSVMPLSCAGCAMSGAAPHQVQLGAKCAAAMLLRLAAELQGRFVALLDEWRT
jgi:hypothetical protein